MAKLTLTNLSSGYSSSGAINTNNDAIEAAVEKTLSRDGTSPNSMEANLDMDSNRITNLPNAVNNTEPVTLAQASSLVGITAPLTQSGVGDVLYPETASETSAAVTPTSTHYPPGNVLRYGALGNGVADDTTAIQDAIDVAEAGGSVVYIPAGTYIVSTQLDVVGDDLTIFGDGRQSVLKTTADINIIRVNGSDRLTVANLAFEGNSTGTNQDGVRCLTMTDSLFDNLHVKNVGHDAILLISGCIGNTVSNSHVEGSGDDGINIGGDTPASTDNTVVGCVVEGCTNDGIHVSDNSLDTAVTGNVCYGNDNGIGLFNAQRCTVSGNTLSGNTTYGIHTPSSTVSHLAITGNSISGGARAINFSAGANCTISGNSIHTPTVYGIVVSGATLQQDFEMSISGNIIDGGCSTAGIFLSGCRSVTVTANHVADVGGDGVYINSDASFGCADITVADNIINNAGDEGIEVETGTNSEHIVLVNNTIRDAAGRGIEYRGGPYFKIDGNQVIDAADYGILISASVLGDGKGTVNANNVEGGCTAEGMRINNYNEVICTHNIVYDITGSVGLNVPAGNVVVEGNMIEDTVSGGQQGVLTVKSASGSTPGTVTNKVEVFDKAGSSVGFVAVYDAVT